MGKQSRENCDAGQRAMNILTGTGIILSAVSAAAIMIGLIYWTTWTFDEGNRLMEACASGKDDIVYSLRDKNIYADGASYDGFCHRKYGG